MTFRELYVKWRETKSLFVKKSTMSAYENSLRNRILPQLGDINIDEINTSVLQEFVLCLISSGLSVKSVKDIVIIIKMLLKYASEMDIATYRQFNIKYPSRNTNDTKVIETYSEIEQKKIIQHIINNPSPRNLGILIAICTGMRIGEICALKWMNINIDNKTIAVKQTVQRIYDGSADKKTQIHFDHPKTFDSNREIPIQKDLLLILKKFKAVSNDDYFVISGSSNVIEPRTYRNYYHNLILNDVGLGRLIKFHGLRHTFATKLIANGAEVTAVSKIMGHANVSITMNLYVHPTMESKSDCINKSMKGLF